MSSDVTRGLPVLGIFSIILSVFYYMIIATSVYMNILKMMTIVGRTMPTPSLPTPHTPPKDVYLLIPRTCKRYFADVIKALEIGRLFWIYSC